MIHTLYNDDPERLRRCPDVDASNFRYPMDVRIKAIKDVCGIGTVDIIGNNDFVVILADAFGKADGTYWAISCAENQLELFIRNVLITELNERDSLKRKDNGTM